MKCSSVFGCCSWDLFLLSLLASVTYQLEAHLTTTHNDVHCGNITTSDVNIILYTRQSFTKPVRLLDADAHLNRNVHIDPNKETKVIIHGFNQNYWTFARPFVIGKMYWIVIFEAFQFQSCYALDFLHF